MLYLMMHSTHFIYNYMVLDIIMVKDYSDCERGKSLLPLHGLFFPNTCKEDKIKRKTTFITVY